MSAYAGRRVAVTGGTGFIGTRLIAALRADGAIVTRLDRPGFDLADAPAAAAAVETAQAEIVFHLAAAGVGDLFGEQARQIAVNALGTMAVLEGARRAGTRRVVCFGTCFEYAAASGPSNEGATLSPRNPYAASKAAGFALARHAADVLGQDVVWLRPFAVYGSGQPKAKLIPSLLDATLTGSLLTLGPGDAAWDYVHVDDVVSAALLLGHHAGAPRGTFNAGSGAAHTPRAIAAEIARLTGRGARLAWGARPARAGDPAYICADARRLHALGWQARALTDGLAALVAEARVAA